MIVDAHENGFVVMRDAATLLFSATATLRVYLVTGSHQEGGRGIRRGDELELFAGARVATSEKRP